MARSTSTATTATPAAADNAPVSAPTADPVEQLPAHWIWTKARPMSPPHRPATVLVAMRRDLFLAVVTGQARSARAASALAAGWTATDP